MPEYGCASPEPRANPVLKRSVYTVDGVPCTHSTSSLSQCSGCWASGVFKAGIGVSFRKVTLSMS